MKKKQLLKFVSLAIACLFSIESTGIVYAEALTSNVSDNTIAIQTEDAEDELELTAETDEVDVEMDEDMAYILESLSVSENYVPGELIVTFDNASTAEVEACTGEYQEEADFICESIVDPEAAFPYALLTLEDGASMEDAIKLYSKVPGVAVVQPNYATPVDDWDCDCGFCSAAKNAAIEDCVTVENTEDVEFENEDIDFEDLAELEATDPYQSKQWHLSKIGVTSTWSYLNTYGYTKPTVCVLDSGCDLSNPDLQNVVPKNRCVNAMDASFPQITTDTVGHGTHVTGIIAAQRGNGIGVAGVAAGYCNIAVARIATNTFYTSNEINGVNYAIGIGARVVNMSWGGYQFDPAFKAICDIATEKGIVMIAAAGNDNNKYGSQVHYPSGYDSVIGVISTDSNNNRSTFSNYGSYNFISAPGTGIWSTICYSDYIAAGRVWYASWNGTSMASPVVAGVVANMLAINPTLTVDQVKSIIKSTATDIYAKGFDSTSGYGVINCYKAVQSAYNLKQSVQKKLDSAPSYVKTATSPEDFVKRLYYCCLGRTASTSEIDGWAKQLRNRSKNGGQVAHGFIFSPEFLNKKLSDSDYVDSLYLIFMGRTPDASGKAYWLNELATGMSREYVMNGFSGSDEFKLVCKKCGIQYGQIALTAPRDQNRGVTQFVARLYTRALGRSFDVNGLNDWCNRINTRQMTPYQVAVTGFFHSPEFMQKSFMSQMGASNKTTAQTACQQYVAILYSTFFDRAPDQKGYSGWTTDLMDKYYYRYKYFGKTTDQVLAGFAGSQEFANLMKKYGL